MDEIDRFVLSLHKPYYPVYGGYIVKFQQGNLRILKGYNQATLEFRGRRLIVRNPTTTYLYYILQRWGLRR